MASVEEKVGRTSSQTINVTTGSVVWNVPTGGYFIITTGGFGDTSDFRRATAGTHLRCG